MTTEASSASGSAAVNVLTKKVEIGQRLCHRSGQDPEALPRPCRRRCRGRAAANDVASSAPSSVHLRSSVVPASVRLVANGNAATNDLAVATAQGPFYPGISQPEFNGGISHRVSKRWD